MALTTNLVSYWSMDAASGNESDAVGSNTLADNGTVGAVTGLVSGARDFNGSSQYFEAADDSSLNPASVSLSLWVKIDSYGSGKYSLIAGKPFNNSWGNGGYAIAHHPEGDKIGAWAGTSYGLGAFVAQSTVSTGAWHHLVLTYDGSTIRFYVDGSDVVDVSMSSVASGSSQAFRVAHTPGLDYFDGKVDEVGLWSRALSSSEVTQLYNSGSGLAYPFSGGSTGSGAGSSSATFSPTAVGASLAAASGAPAVAFSPTGAGASLFGGSGTPAVTFSPSAVGQSTAAAAGSAAVAFGASGSASAPPNSGDGAAAVAFSPSAVGQSTAAAAGSAAVTFSASAPPVSAGGSGHNWQALIGVGG